MKLNKEIVLEYIQNKVDESDHELHFTTSDLASQLNMQRTNLSSYLNALVESGDLIKVKGKPVYYKLAKLEKNNDDSIFKLLVGSSDTLKHAIELSKAMILYPNKQLSVFICGPQGSGKSAFAYTMFAFAREMGIIKNTNELYKVNCRSFEDDNRDIDDYLFNSKDGIFKKAKGGMILLDHVEYLNSDTRDKILELINTQNNILDDIHLLIIGDSDNMSETNQKLYSSKTSITINMPKLSEYTYQERFEFINLFFNGEALRMKKKIRINAEVLRCIMLYDVPGNIKQLKNDILLGCANGYVREFDHNDDEIFLYMNDFPNEIRKGFLYYRDNREMVESLIPSNYSYTFMQDTMKKTAYAIQIDHEKSIYDTISRKVTELKKRDITDEEINHIINVDLEADFKNARKKLMSNTTNYESISKIVDLRIVTMVEKFLKEASTRFNRVYSQSVFYGLCIHLSTVIEKRENREINADFKEIIDKNKREYQFAYKFVEQLEETFDISLSVDEAIFITMFLTSDSEDDEVAHPIVVVTTHGNSAASSIVDVVRKLVNIDNIYPFDMPLDMNMDQAYQQLKDIIVQHHQGRGVLLIYDMGSFERLSKILEKELGIPIRSINVPITLLALEASRKAKMIDNIDELHNIISRNPGNYNNVKTLTTKIPNDRPLVITLCMTGQGGAVQMKKYIEQNIDNSEISIMPLAINDRSILLQEINEFMKQYNIECIVGTFDPQIHDIPFVSITTLFDTPKENLKWLLSVGGSYENEENFDFDYEAIFDYLNEQLEGFDVRKLKKILPRVLNNIKKKTDGLTKDQELGLLIHIACGTYAIYNNEPSRENVKKNQIINKNKKLYNDLKNILRPIEENYDISFPDDEIANIIGIVKKI